MKKNQYLKLALIIFVLIFSFKLAYAKSNGSPFGGKITNTKALRISTLEKQGYKCTVPGETIEIKPIKSGVTSFLIPSNVKSKTGYKTNVGQWILGKYYGVSSITCARDGYDTVYVTLDTITLYGTSKS